MSKRESGVALVYDFYFQELLTPFRSRISLHAFQLVVCTLYALTLPVLLIFSLGLFVVVKPLVADQRGTASTLVVMFLAANLYIAGAYIAREIFSERRFTVANSPNASFYRALDIKARDVFVVYSGLRTAAFYLGLLVVDTAFVAMFHSSIDFPVTGMSVVLALPVASFALTLAVSAAVASRKAAPRPVKWSAFIPPAVAFFCIGFATARFIAEPILDSGWGTAFGQGQVRLLLGIVAAAAPLVAVISGLFLVVYLRRLTRNSFPIHPTHVAVDGSTPARADRWGGAFAKLRILHREVARSKIYPLVRKNFLILATVLLVCLGVVASGASVLPLTGIASRVQTGFQGFTFVTFIVMVALLLTVVGPTTFAAQFRFEWENLMVSHWRIASSAAVYYLVPVVALAVGFSVLLALVVGALSIGPVALAVSVAAGAMIAESTITPKVMADGSSSQSAVAAFVVLLLAVPTFASVAVRSTTFDVLAVVYSLCLLGGAIVCMARRTRTMPLKSAM
jgi:hypothetical protein